MAIAIPDKATMLASTPTFRMIIKVDNTANGSMLAIMKEARRLKIRTIITMIQIKTSSVRADSNVPIVSLINPVRS